MPSTVDIQGFINSRKLYVETHDALHAILFALPLFPFMEISVTPLARHPSSIRQPQV